MAPNALTASTAVDLLKSPRDGYSRPLPFDTQDGGLCKYTCKGATAPGCLCRPRIQLQRCQATLLGMPAGDARAGSSCFRPCSCGWLVRQFYRRAYHILRRRRFPLLSRPAHPPKVNLQNDALTACMEGACSGQGIKATINIHEGFYQRLHSSGVESYLLGEGCILESGPKPAFTRHTLQPLRDMRHLEQPSFTALAPPASAAGATSCSACSGG